MADKRDPAAGHITELNVSGHAMRLEPGLYCVFNAPDSPVPSVQSGLPGVRISSAPGSEGGRVEIAGFQADGWLGSDAAALIRVIDAPASVVVTIYQEPDSKGEAPRLQVVTLSGQGAQPSAPNAPEAPAHADGTQPIEAMAHIYGRGDVGGALAGWIGEPGSNRWIEGFAVSPEGVSASDIEYQAVLGRGWLSPWAEGGQFCGSRGMSLPILGMRVKLTGAAARTHRVHLTASFVDGTRVGPVHDGEPCEAASLAALEAFQIAIMPKKAGAEPRRAAAAPTPMKGGGRAKAKNLTGTAVKAGTTTRAASPRQVEDAAETPRPRRAKMPAAKVTAPVARADAKAGAKAVAKPMSKGKGKSKPPAASAPARSAPKTRAPTTRRR